MPKKNREKQTITPDEVGKLPVEELFPSVEVPPGAKEDQISPGLLPLTTLLPAGNGVEEEISPRFPSAAELIAAVEPVGRELNFDDEIEFFPAFFSYGNVRLWMTEPNGLYYRMLAAFTKIYKPKNICEIGTCHGASAMALAKFGCPVTTYDITLENLADPAALASMGVRAVRLDDRDACVALPFSQYDVIFIDIGSHTGGPEKLIHERLVREGWKGVVLYDDVNWEGLRDVWRGIEGDKAETDWHGDSGFGLIVYR